jgi:hypothetical protein
MNIIRAMVFALGTSAAVFYTLLCLYLHIGRFFQSDDQILYAHLAVGMIILCILSFFIHRADESKIGIREWLLAGCFYGVGGFMLAVFRYNWPTLSDTARLVGIIAAAIVLILYAGVILPMSRGRSK